MPNDDPFEGLNMPEDPLTDLERATQQLTVRTEERRYGKKVVVIEGFDADSDVETLASELKSTLGTGGTAKGDHIELQGNHDERVRELLTEEGYHVEE